MCESKIQGKFYLIEPSSGDVLNKLGEELVFLVWLPLKIGKNFRYCAIHSFIYLFVCL